MTAIVGINAYHGDSSACLLIDGKLCAAAEEERFRRIKHWAGFPSNAIQYCLDEGGISLAHVDHVAVNADPRANFFRKIVFTARHLPAPALVIEKLRERKRKQSMQDQLGAAFPEACFTGTVHQIEHHFAHLASAYLVSPFNEAVAVSVDGFGDFASAAWGAGHGNQLSLDGKVLFPHSLGIFYMAMTQYLGFPHWGDEYKVMGLAPYGRPAHLDAMRKLVRLRQDGTFELDLSFFRHHRQRIQQWPGSAPHVDQVFSDKLEHLLGPARTETADLTQRHRDIARSVQAMYEEAFFNLLNAAHRRYGLNAVAIAGGCGMNSVANGRICQNTAFKHVYVQSAAGDAGGAIGAAFAAWQKVSNAPRQFVMDHAYWGPAYSNAEIEELLTSRRASVLKAGCTVKKITEERALCHVTASAVAGGKVVGWFQGRMEWGPRALGNRSIVCDPRREDMKELLNRKIKRRESFRPFAPSILREAVGEWFEEDGDVPFMMQVFQIRPEKRVLIPAVTHVDGSGRLQTVTREANPLYHGLIEAFRDLTGVPMVLNTSFNENEPVVCRPEEALDCFLRTHMDVLVMGRHWIERIQDQ
jgi:carbamoyltransferase